MSVFDRTNTLAEEVAELERENEEIKATQIVGNDNLIVRFYPAQLASNAITAGSTALFKATFTFDTPSTAYVDKSIVFFVNSGSFFYTDFAYDDPSTSSSLTQKSWFYAITPDANGNIAVNARARSTQPGTISLVRLS